MAQDETISIVRFDTGEAVTSIRDLKDNIKFLKDEIADLEIGSQDYQERLSELKVNQNALKDAMYATSATMEQVTEAATGAGESYNALVHRMAAMKEELRATDISTEAGAKRFAELAGQINETNEKLKVLDKMQGNYQRNVGNYKSALDGLGKSFASTAGSAKSLIAPIAGVATGLEALSATPVVGMLGLLAAALSKVISGMKTSEENTNSWRLALAAFQPIADAFTRSMQEVGAVVASLAQKFGDLLMRWGLLDAEAAKHRQAMEANVQAYRQTERTLLIANAQLEEEVAEARAKATDKEKYSIKERLDALEKAQWAERQIAKNNILLAENRVKMLKEESKITDNSIEANTMLAQAEADVIRARTAAANAERTILRQINALRKEAGMAAKQANNDIEDSDNEVVSNLAYDAQEIGEILEWLEKKREDYDRMISAGMGDILSSLDEQQAVFTDDLQTWLDTQLTAEFDAMMQEKDITQRRIDTYLQMAGAVSNIFGALADIYEANEEADEEAAGKAKALRTASAIVQTISGAVGAFMSTWTAPELPLTAKYVLAPLNASAVLAAGYAQVKAINSTKMGKSSGGVVQAPSVTTSVPQVRTITGQNEEERLNQMASNQRVYLVTSDVEAALSKRKVQVQETEF